MSKRTYKNESAESMLAREMLEAVWYDNGGLTNREGQWGKFKRRLQRILKKLPKEEYELFFTEKEDETGEMVSFAEWFAIGTDYDTRREFIRKHRALYKIDCVLNEWFDDVKPLSIEEYLGEK